MTTPALGDDPAEVTVDGAVWSRTGITANGRHLYVPRDSSPFERGSDKTLPALVAAGHTVEPRHPAEAEAERLTSELRSLRADYQRALAEARGHREHAERLAAQLEQLKPQETHRKAPSAARASGAQYPLMVQLPGGRVRHAAREGADGRVFTLCRKAGRPIGDGSNLPYCRACIAKPNPIYQQSGH